MLKTIFLSLLLSGPALCSAGMADRDAYLHFMNGMVQERRGNFDLALQEYQRTLLLAPGEAAVQKQALNLALHVGKLDDAARWAEFVVSADSATAENWVLYGNVKWARGEIESARGAYERAAALDASNHEALYQLASLSSSKDPDKAIAYLRKYLEIRPEDAPDIYYQIAVLYNMKNDLAAAEKSLLLSKDADSFYLQPRYMLANYYEAKSDTAAAINEYRELLELESRNPELLDHLGELYASPAVGNLPEAEKYFLLAWELDKTDPSACFWLSVINEERRDFAAAASYMEGSRALKDDPGAVLRLGYYYTQSGRYLKAVGMLEDAAKKWPENNEVAYFLALGYDDTGKVAKGLELLKSLVKRAPGYAEARMQYGVLCEREGNIAEAEENFRYLLGVNPANANVLNYLGYALADRGLKLEEAQVLISSAVALEPANGAYRDSLAWVYFKLGHTEQARAEITNAVKLINDDPVVWAHAGDIYSAAGDLKTAWRAYKNSWLLEKPAKRDAVAKKIKVLLGKIPEAAAAELQKTYLKDFSPAGLEFATFAKVQAKLPGKSVKFDAMLHFSPPDNFTISVMGPLMVPLWNAKLSGDGLAMDSMALSGIAPDKFNYWAALVTEELGAWFSGAYLEGLPVAQKDCAKGPLREVCLDDDRAWPVSVTPLKETRLDLRPGDYFLKNLYLFPRTLEFKLPFVSLKITLDSDQMNFAAVNELKLPE
ncbi:MAG TPA: tetratricopeptide repeat protein [Elusimicrobiales bacterium]|nr:tetratricopeptide repeat protein [Elusimicrobiales bacterium]